MTEPIEKKSAVHPFWPIIWSVVKRILLFVMLALPGTSSLHAATYYLDPIHGDNQNDGSAAAPWGRLEDVVAANMIASFRYSPLPYDPSSSRLVEQNANGQVHGGDTLLLLSGLHGSIFLQNYYNERPITIMAAPDAVPVLRHLHLQAGRNWRFVGLQISSESYGAYDGGNLVHLEGHSWQGPVSRIDIERCTVFSATHPWSTAQDWLDNVATGMYIRADSGTVTECTVTNIDMGILVLGNQCRVLRSRVINFSGDGMRVLGSGNLIEGNLIKNCYKVDDNHDDGIQSYTVNGIVADNDTIRGNTIINNDDPSQALSGPLQGIGCFDGFYNNWVVENNLIIVNHWHGITFLGARNCRIINNTVLDPSPQQVPGASRISIGDTKDDQASSGCVVNSNVTNQLNVDGSTSHNVILKDLASYAQNFVDPVAFDFHLRSESVCIDSAETATAPEIDQDGVLRPWGPRSDVGCYEFTGTAAVFEIPDTPVIDIYPRPAGAVITLDQLGEVSQLYSLRNLSGEIVLRGRTHGPTLQLHVSHVPAGIYVLAVGKRLFKIMKR